MKPHRQPCILLIEADDAIRSSFDRVLSGAGYKAILAGDGSRALDQWANARIDLIILDMDTLNEDADLMLDSLSQCNPPLPILILSAQASRSDCELVRAIGGLMEKPFEAETALRQVAALLDEPQSRWAQAANPVRAIILQGLRARTHNTLRGHLPYQSLYH